MSRLHLYKALEFTLKYTHTRVKKKSTRVIISYKHLELKLQITN